MEQMVHGAEISGRSSMRADVWPRHRFDRALLGLQGRARGGKAHATARHPVPRAQAGDADGHQVRAGGADMLGSPGLRAVYGHQCTPTKHKQKYMHRGDSTGSDAACTPRCTRPPSCNTSPGKSLESASAESMTNHRSVAGWQVHDAFTFFCCTP